MRLFHLSNHYDNNKYLGFTLFCLALFLKQQMSIDAESSQELLNTVDKLILMLSKPSLYDNELELQKQKYISYVDSVYKNSPIASAKAESIPYTKERDELKAGGTLMRKKIDEFRKQQSQQASPIQSTVFVHEHPKIIVTETEIFKQDPILVAYDKPVVDKKLSRLQVPILKDPILPKPSSPLPPTPVENKTTPVMPSIAVLPPTPIPKEDKLSLALPNSSQLPTVPKSNESSIIDLPSSPMRHRAVSSFGISIDEPELESAPPTSPSSPTPTTKVLHVTMPKVPKDFETRDWKIDPELSILVLQNGFDAIEELLSKSNCGRVYSELTTPQQRSLIFSKFLHHQGVDKTQCIQFSDGLINWIKQFKEIIPADWLKNKNKSQNIFASMQPIHQEILQIITEHLDNIFDRFPSQTSRISKAFGKALIKDTEDLEFIKSFLTKSK